MKNVTCKTQNIGAEVLPRIAINKKTSVVAEVFLLK
jgi:hypothetical protein